MCPTGTSLRPTQIPGDATSEYRRAFDVLDVDHDGKISSDDLQAFYTTTSSPVKSGFHDDDGDAEMIRAMISVADANKDGYVEYDEFERVLNNNNNGGKNVKEDSSGDDEGGVMREVFNVMDKDGDGLLGFDDLRSYLHFAGISVVDEEIKAMIMLGGGDFTSPLSFHAFLNILALHSY